MVEGPGATRNADKAKQAIGMWVKNCVCNSGAIPDDLVGRQLLECFSVGKEVFLIFGGPLALRLHFGMNGCLWCTKSTSAYPRRPIGLEMHLESDNQSIIVIQTADATLNVVSATVARNKYARLHSLDVCNTDSDLYFDAQAVLHVMRTKCPKDMICDAVLNQEVCPGAGNIIKVEGLHLAKIHPQRLVCELSDAEISKIIQECRSYALSWYHTGRSNAIKRVYNQTVCQTCQSASVNMVKLGNDLKRVTFWCNVCQPGSATTLKSCVVQKLRPLHFDEACPTHGTNGLRLKRVRKGDSNNTLRLFRTCSLPKCPYFEWADRHFPQCHCRVISILRVSKTMNSGGKWFFSCHKSNDPRTKNIKTKQQGCGYFEWASPQHLAPFGKCLTPLL